MAEAPDIGTYQPFPDAHTRAPLFAPSEVAVKIGARWYPTRAGYEKVADALGYRVSYEPAEPTIDTIEITAAIYRGDERLGAYAGQMPTGVKDPVKSALAQACAEAIRLYARPVRDALAIILEGAT